MSKPDRALSVAIVAAAVIMATVGTIAYLGRDATRQPVQITYPHGGRCDRPPDRWIRNACRVARELHASSNAGDPAVYCRHRMARDAYRACVAGIVFADPGLTEFQTDSYTVLYARLIAAGVARARVHVNVTDPDTGAHISEDVYERYDLIDGWWRIVGLACASCLPPSPAS